MSEPGMTITTTNHLVSLFADSGAANCPVDVSPTRRPSSTVPRLMMHVFPHVCALLLRLYTYMHVHTVTRVLDDPPSNNTLGHGRQLGVPRRHILGLQVPLDVLEGYLFPVKDPRGQSGLDVGGLEHVYEILDLACS